MHIENGHSVQHSILYFKSDLYLNQFSGCFVNKLNTACLYENYNLKNSNNKIKSIQFSFIGIVEESGQTSIYQTKFIIYESVL